MAQVPEAPLSGSSGPTGSTGSADPSEVGQIIVRLDGETFKTVPLSTGDLTIGRAPDNGLALPFPTVSGHHARVHCEPDGPMLTDLGSTNGTMIDGVALARHQPVRLSEGEVVRIGPYELTYQPPQAPVASDQAPVVGTPPDVAVAVAGHPSDNGQRATGNLGRPTFPHPALDPATPSRYLANLPALFQESDFLSRFLLIFETIWEPLEQRQDHIALYFNPLTCPRALLPWLASWLDLTLPPQWPEQRSRQVVAGAMELYRWRGTRYGMERMIETFTGLTPRITEDRARPFVFHIGLSLPRTPGRQHEAVDRAQLETLIRSYKPAYAGYVLEVSDE